MGTRTVTETITLIPSGYAGASNITADSSYVPSRAYANAENTSYSRWSFSSAVTGYVYFTFDTSAIPANATITSITARGKARVNNTTRVKNTSMQLYSGTTAKGSSTAFAMTTASTQNLTPGSGWTRAQLNDLRIRIGGTGSGSSTKRIDFYGADVTITYSYTITTYDITINNSTGATVVTDKAEPLAGETVTITADTLSGIAVTDNGVDVTSQFVEVYSDTVESVPNGNTNSGFTLTDIDNAYTDADDSDRATLTLAGSASGTLYLDLASLDIPSGATIQSMACDVTLQFSRNGSSSGFTSSVQLYANTTAKGSATNWVNSATDVAKTKYSLTVGSWTASELANARVRITATNSARSTLRYIYVYGVTLTVTYQLDDAIYVYTISNVSADHTIVVASSGVQPKLFVKLNGSWVEVVKAYKKVSGSWIEQADATTVFNNVDNFMKGN